MGDNNTMARYQQFFIKALNYVFLILISFLAISLIFFNNSTLIYERPKQILSAVVIFIVLILSILILRRSEKIVLWMTKYYKEIILFSIIIIAFLQLYIISVSSTSIGWDNGILVKAALADDLSKSSYYFSVYPNNLFLLFVFRGIASIFGPSGIWYKLNMLSILAVDVTLVLVFYVVYKIKNLKWAYVAFGLSLCTFGLSAWIIVPYSDILAMPFTIGTYAIYLKLINCAKRNEKIAYSFLISAVVYIGYLIKPTVVIVLIAILLIKLIFNINKINSINKIKHKIPQLALVLLIVSMVLFNNGVWNIIIQNQKVISINSELRTPITHFYMMGLNYCEGRYGAWNSEDVKLTFSYDTKAEKIEANKVVINKRLKEYGAIGYLNFLCNKARWITSEGAFFWGGEGGFAKFDIDDNSSIVCNLIYTNGKYYSYYKYFVQGIWICIMCLCACPIVFNIKNNEPEDINISTMRCTLLGIILFILLFEGRSRYLILYLPFFCIAATVGVKSILDIHKYRLNKKQEK